MSIFFTSKIVQYHSASAKACHIYVYGKFINFYNNYLNLKAC